MGPGNLELREAPDGFAWALSFSERCCRCPRMGPSVFTAAAADGFAWAHWFSGRCCRCLSVCPLHLQQALPMASLGPIMSWEGLPMSKSGPNAFAAAAADSFAWAH